METILTRCPSCSKLYNIAEKDISSDSPQFNCVKCESRFWFGFDKKEFHSYGATAISVTSHLVEKKEENIAKTCPKCGARNVSTPGSTSKECSHCGVIFEKVQPNIPISEDDSALGGTPKLSDLWEKLMNDFEDLNLHDQFVNQCRSENALPFASKKYGKILSINPHDEIAKIMRNKVIIFASPLPKNQNENPIISLRRILWAGAIVSSLTILIMLLFIFTRQG